MKRVRKIRAAIQRGEQVSAEDLIFYEQEWPKETEASRKFNKTRDPVKLQAWLDANAEKRASQQKEWQRNNPNKQQEYKKRHYAKVKADPALNEALLETQRKRERERKATDPEYVEHWRNKEKEYYYANLEENRAKKREQASKAGPQIKLKIRILSLINSRLQSRIREIVNEDNKARPYSRKEKLEGLEFTIGEFMAHMEARFKDGMGWHNYGSEWETDHINPDSMYNYTSTEDPGFKASWTLSNLQPLWGWENDQKGSKIPEQPKKKIQIVFKQSK